MSENADHFELFVKGSIIGHLIGDALGHSYNFDKDKEPSDYTALGSLSLCTMANINEYDGIDRKDLIEKFYDLYIGGYLSSDIECHDLGPISAEALKKYSNGMPVDRCGAKEESSNDSDCLARMLPIGLYYANENIGVLISKSHEICQITHAHIMSQVCCAVYCLMIRNFLLQKSEKVFESLNNYYNEEGWDEYKDQLNMLRTWRDNNECKGTNRIEDCFWSAWQSFSKNENDYSLAVAATLELGNDRNATTAIVGSLTALRNGLNNIPARWLRTIKLSSEVMEIIIKFVDSVVSRTLSKS